MTRSTTTSVKAGLRRTGNRLLNFFSPPVVILLYHRVTRLEPDVYDLAVSPENFRAHIDFLKTRRLVRGLEEALASAPAPAVVITFDDGYADNFLEAAPILKEFDLPATFFIATGTIGTKQEFWWDEVERLLLSSKETPPQLTLSGKNLAKTWRTSDARERFACFAELHPMLKEFAPTERDACMDKVREWAADRGAGREANRSMTVNELRELSRQHGITLGAHTVTHGALSRMSAAGQREEILTSKMQVEAWVGRPVDYFAYPFGGSEDFNTTTVALCREAGFAAALANMPGPVRSWDDRFQVRRFMVRDWPIAEFQHRLTGFWTG